jgi:hypothetical protein
VVPASSKAIVDRLVVFRHVERVEHGLRQAADALPVGGGNRMRLAHAELVKLGQQRRLAHALGLVDGQEDTFAGLPQVTRDVVVLA